MFFNPCPEAAVSFSDVRQLTARAAKFVYNTALELFIRSVFQVQIGVILPIYKTETKSRFLFTNIH